MSWFSYLLLMYRKQYGWCFMALGQFLKSKVAPVQFSLRTKCLWNPVIKVGKPRPLGDISSSYYSLWASQVALVVKNLPANSGDTGSNPGSARSPGGRHMGLTMYKWSHYKWSYYQVNTWGKRRLLEKMDMFMGLIVMAISYVYVNLETHLVVCIKYVWLSKSIITQ